MSAPPFADSTVVKAPPPDAPAEDPALDPPSLRRRAPVRIELALKSGHMPTLARRRVHLVSGQVLVLRVVPQHDTDEVEITAEGALHTIVRPHVVSSGPAVSAHAEFSARLQARLIPLPGAGNLHVTVLDKLPDPARITIPVTVWPATSTYLLWWLVAFLSIVGLRWQRIFATTDSFLDILKILWRDLPHMLGLLGLGFLVVFPLRGLAWIVSLTHSSPGSE